MTACCFSITEAEVFISSEDCFRAAHNSRCFAVMLSVLVGCESEADKQHHLYNLQQCSAQALTLVGGDMFKDDDVKTRKVAYREVTLGCMVDAEHTTREFQEDKHDDYLENAVDFQFYHQQCDVDPSKYEHNKDWADHEAQCAQLKTQLEKGAH
jgi:hypothetical protein